MKSVIRNMLSSTMRIVALGSFMCAVVMCCVQGAAERDVGRELRKAVRSGDVKSVLHFLSNSHLESERLKIVLDARNKHGETVLFQTASRGYTEVVRLLLDKGADLHISDKFGQTPLHIASWNGYVAVVTMLLQEGARIDEQDRYGYTPLHRPSKAGSLEIVQVLLGHAKTIAASADVFDVKEWIDTRDNNDGLTALHPAALNGRADVVRVLLEAGALADKVVKSGKYAGQTAMHMAATMSNVHGDVARIAEYERVLAYLAGVGKDDARGVLQEYLDVGDRENKTPLHYAALHGKRKLAIKLCELGAMVNKVDSKKRTPLHCAVSQRHRYTAKALCDHGAKVNAGTNEGETPLHAAAWNGDLKMARFLLGKGADVNRVTRDGATPLYYAVALGRGEDLENYLLEQGAELAYSHPIKDKLLELIARDASLRYLRQLNEKIADGVCSLRSDANGGSILHFASREGNATLLEALLGDRSSDFTDSIDTPALDINETDNYGDAPLHIAARRGDLDSVNVLCRAEGCSVDVRDSYKNTPLHIAVQRGHLSVVEALVGRGADIEVKNKSSRTPLHCAIGHKRKKIVEFLCKRGANLSARDSHWETPKSLARKSSSRTIKRMVKDYERGREIKIDPSINSGV